MAVPPKTGVLGAAMLGSLVLGAPLVWLKVSPRTGHVASRISADGAQSGLSKAGSVSTIAKDWVSGSVG